MILFTRNKQKINIVDKPINGGGQGKIHLVGVGKHTHVAKIFNKPTPQLQKRIEYMSNNNPFTTVESHIQDAFAWPLEPLYNDKGLFKGFLMKYVENSIKLFELTLPSSSNLSKKEWCKFASSSPGFYTQRLKILYNISKALDILDKYGKYRVVDLKPANIMLKNNGHVVIIDCDSFQIADRGKLIHKAEVTTEEYCPPEYFNMTTKRIIEPSWDYFSFAIICYQLLFCIHPFNASHNRFGTIPELIQNGLFVYGHKAAQLRVIPPPHKKFTQLLSSNLRQLFLSSFINGHADPTKRADFTTWNDVLLKEIKLLGSQPGFRPTIKLFKINSSTIPNKTMLCWEVFNATKVVVNGMKVSPIGKMDIDAINGKHTIIADNNGLVVNRTISLVLPAIKSFDCLLSNKHITYNWEVANAYEITINGMKVPTTGTIKGPLRAGTHTLQATSASGIKLTKKHHIDCLAVINTFTHLPNRTSCLLSWDVWNSKTVKINGILVENKGVQMVSLQKKKYLLTAQDHNGKETSRNIMVDCPAVINKFEIIKTPYIAKLIWDCLYVKECFLNNEKVPDRGERMLPLNNKIYKMDIVDFNGVRSTYTQQLDAPDQVNFMPAAKVVNATKFSSVKNHMRTLIVHGTAIAKNVYKTPSKMKCVGNLRG